MSGQSDPMTDSLSLEGISECDGDSLSESLCLEDIGEMIPCDKMDALYRKYRDLYVEQYLNNPLNKKSKSKKLKSENNSPKHERGNNRLNKTNFVNLFITFTLNDDNKNIPQETFKKYMMKCVNTKRQNCTNYYGACEYTKIGRLHGHLFIQYEKKYNKEGWGKNFIKKVTKWCFGNIDVRYTLSDNGICDYVGKDLIINNFSAIGEKFRMDHTVDSTDT